MNYFITHLTKILNKNEKRTFLTVLFGTFLVGLLETISIGSLVGFLIIFFDPQALISKIGYINLENYLLSISYKKLILLSSITLILIFIIKKNIQIFFHYLEISFIKSLQIKFTKNIFSIFLKKPYIFHVNQNSNASINTILNETKRTSDYINNILMISRETIILIFLLILMMFVNFKLSLFLSLIMISASIIFYLLIKKRLKI